MFQSSGNCHDRHPFQAPRRRLRQPTPDSRRVRLTVTAIVSTLALAAPLRSQAQMMPAPVRLSPSTVVNTAGCIAGFRLEQSGNTLTCTSAPVRCVAPFSLPDARIVDNRFIYTCTRVQ